MRFHYTAVRSDGNTVEDEINAGSPSEAIQMLALSGLRPLSLKEIKSTFLETKHNVTRSSFKLEDQILLARYLALMLKVGTDLLHAIDILIDDFDKPGVKAFLIEMRTNLEKGQPFYTSFANYPRVFSPVFVNMIRAGEASGNLESSLEDISITLERQRNLNSRIKGALIYPILLFTMSVVILTVLVTFAIPKIANVFSSSGFDPPIFSKIVFSIGLFFGDHIIAILGVFTLVAALLAALFYQSLAFRRILGRFFRKLPVVRTVVEKVSIQRFATTLGSLMKAGISITEALEITANAVGNDEMKMALFRISREGLAKGLTIGESFRRETTFPKMVTNLIAISEKSGHTEDILNTLSSFYEGEIDETIKALVSLLEPLMLLFIGIVIATIALAIIVPVYQLIGQF